MSVAHAEVVASTLEQFAMPFQQLDAGQPQRQAPRPVELLPGQHRHLEPDELPAMPGARLLLLAVAGVQDGLGRLPGDPAGQVQVVQIELAMDAAHGHFACLQVQIGTPVLDQDTEQLGEGRMG